MLILLTSSSNMAWRGDMFAGAIAKYEQIMNISCEKVLVRSQVILIFYIAYQKQK